MKRFGTMSVIFSLFLLVFQTSVLNASVSVIDAGISLQDSVVSTPGELLQFKTGGHILGFNEERMYVVGMGYALTEEFVGANKSIPAAEHPNNDTNASVKTDGAPEMGTVIYHNLWNGIDLRYEAKAGGIAESTYILKPGARVQDIGLRYNADVDVQKNGTLRFKHPTEKGYFTMTAPVAWQEIEKKRVKVDIAFKKHKDGTIGFEAGSYDTTHPLIIDPTYEWNTFHGSTNYDEGHGIAVDKSGNVYVTGLSYVTWGNPVDNHTTGTNPDIVVLKLNSSGALQWNTFHGSGSTDYGFGIAVDKSGNIYVTGRSDATWGNPVDNHTADTNPDIVALKLDSLPKQQLWQQFQP